MAVVELDRISQSLKTGDRLMGLDLGTKTIGLALSDVTLTIASPLETIKRVKFTPDVQKLEALIDEYEVAGLVLGLPVSMDGTEGPRCQSTRQFANNLLERRDIALAFWDERLSTAAVQRILISEMDMTRKRRAEVVDKAAAAYILQGALDSLGSSFR
ncbi:MAG: Holliday junction resolvase RuvX [Rhodospirillales bacterium]|nr:Holliday junction resolvase RuvX [Rhodospirillales bacterium]